MTLLKKGTGDNSIPVKLLSYMAGIELGAGDNLDTLSNFDHHNRTGGVSSPQSKGLTRLVRLSVAYRSGGYLGRTIPLDACLSRF